MKALLLLAAAFVLGGCAPMANWRAAEGEKMLAAAGFRKVAIDGELAAGSVAFEFADYCNCRYVGGAKEAAVLQEMRATRRARHEELARTFSP